MVKVLGQVHMVEMLDMVGMVDIENIVDMGNMVDILFLEATQDMVGIGNMADMTDTGRHGEDGTSASVEPNRMPDIPSLQYKAQWPCHRTTRLPLFSFTFCQYCLSSRSHSLL